MLLIYLFLLFQLLSFVFSPWPIVWIPSLLLSSANCEDFWITLVFLCFYFLMKVWPLIICPFSIYIYIYFLYLPSSGLTPFPFFLFFNFLSREEIHLHQVHITVMTTDVFPVAIYIHLVVSLFLWRRMIELHWSPYYSDNQCFQNVIELENLSVHGLMVRPIVELVTS